MTRGIGSLRRVRRAGGRRRTRQIGVLHAHCGKKIMTTAAGIDAGSVAVKAVLMADGRPIAWLREGTRPDIAGQCEDMLRRLPGEAPAGTPEPEAVCATGYGRNLAGAERTVSEIVTNAAGAGWIWHNWDELAAIFGEPPRPEERPEPPRTIIDIGGQDSKVVTFSEDGMVDDFAMNDRCAAGTGRFLEVMARALETDLEHLDGLALGCSEPASISTACTVFAESEVVSLLGEGVDRERVAAGLFHSVARRVVSLAERIGYRPPVLLDGGPSASRALARALGDELGTEPAVPPRGDLVTAIGAARLAGRESSSVGSMDIEPEGGE